MFIYFILNSSIKNSKSAYRLCKVRIESNHVNTNEEMIAGNLDADASYADADIASSLLEYRVC